MEIEIKSRTIEFAAKLLEDIFSEDAPNLAVEISAHKEKGVTLSAGYAGCCVTLPLATARVIEPGVGVANLGGLLAAFLALPRGEIAVATDSKPGMIVFSSGVRMRLDMPVGTVTRPCGVVLRGNERCAVVDTSALLNAIDDVRHAMAKDYDRPILRAVKLEISPDLRLATAATDGRRLAFVERKLGITTSLPADGGSFEVELSAAAVRFILSAPHGDRTSIFLVEHDRVKILTGGSSAIFTAPGGFPKWRDVVPAEETPQVAGLPCQETSAALRALLTFAGFDEDDDPADAPHVKITREKDSVELKRVVAPDDYILTGDFTAHFNVGLTEHPPFSVAINAKYLLDALGEHTGSVIIRARKNESDAGYGILRLDFEDDADIHEVIMPLREI